MRETKVYNTKSDIIRIEIHNYSTMKTTWPEKRTIKNSPDILLNVVLRFFLRIGDCIMLCEWSLFLSTFYRQKESSRKGWLEKGGGGKGMKIFAMSRIFLCMWAVLADLIVF